MKPDLHWDGAAAWWPRYGGGVPGGDLYLWMCAQDLGLELWSQLHRLERHGQYDNEPIRLENCSEELSDILINALPYNEYRGDLSGAFAKFSKMVAQQLVLDGCMPFEVRGGWELEEETPKLSQARLQYVYPQSLTRLGPWLFQSVPRSGESHLRESVSRLNPTRIVTFRPPSQYRRSLDRIRRELPLIATSERKWAEGLGTHRKSEDFKTMHRLHVIRQARLTAPVGWNARQLFLDQTADFHWTLRELRWMRFCIEVRDQILGTLAGAFTMIGSWRGENPRLVWDQLPTLQQVDFAESRIMGEGAAFGEVLKPFQHRSTHEEAPSESPVAQQEVG